MSIKIIENLFSASKATILERKLEEIKVCKELCNQNNITFKNKSILLSIPKV